MTQHVKSYLSNKPQLLQRYVGAGYSVAQHALVPVNVLLRHLILVQGLDPNAVPGEKDRLEFLRHLEGAFHGLHSTSFDDDCDLSWVSKKFDQTRKTLSDLNLTREDFNRYTNVGNLQATQALEVEQVKEPFPPRVVFETVSGVPVTIDQTPLGELADLLSFTPGSQDALKVSQKSEEEKKQSLDEKVKAAKESYDSVSAETLKDALKNIIDYAKLLENSGDGKSVPEAERGADYRQHLIRLRDLAYNFRDSGDEKPPRDAVMRDELKNLQEEPAVDPGELFAQTDYLRDVKETILRGKTPEHLPRRVLAVKKHKKINLAKTGKTDAVKTTRGGVHRTAAEEATEIQKLVEQGTLDPSDINALINEGLDEKSVEYWRKHYSPPVKITKKGAHKTTAVTKAQARRLVNEMVIRGLCQPDDEAVNAQIAENMKFDLTSFEALERVVQKHSLLLNQEALDPKFKGNFRRAPKPTKYCR